MIPIAGDDGGNSICIDVGKKNYGKIYFWDHEEGGVQKFLISDSFDKFISSLKDKDAGKKKFIVMEFVLATKITAAEAYTSVLSKIIMSYKYSRSYGCSQFAKKKLKLRLTFDLCPQDVLEKGIQTLIGKMKKNSIKVISYKIE